MEKGGEGKGGKGREYRHFSLHFKHWCQALSDLQAKVKF